MTNNQLTFENIRENIDPVDELQYEVIESSYRTVQMVLTAFGYLVLAASTLFLLLLDDSIWCIIAECLVFAAWIVNMVIVSKAWKFKGYALRDHDISYRSGVIFPKITTVPYNRMQQVSVKQNPIAKLLNLYSVEVVNGAQTLAALTIPGLTEERANQIKSIVIDRLKYEKD